MRIVYLCTDRGIALGGHKGASVHMAEVVSALARAGAEVLLLPSGIADRRLELPDGIVVDPLPAAATDDALADWIVARLRAFGADALYERLALHSAAGASAAGRLGIPHVVEMNAPLPSEAARYRTLEDPKEAARLESLVLRSADRVLVVSEELARYAGRLGATRVEVHAERGRPTPLPRAVPRSRAAMRVRRVAPSVARRGDSRRELAHPRAGGAASPRGRRRPRARARSRRSAPR